MFKRNYSSNHRGFSITLEEDDLDDDVLDNDTDVEVEDEAAQHLEDDLNDVEGVEQDIKTIGENSDTLGNIADKLQEQEENGGATPETMEIVEVAVEHCISKLRGYSTGERITPSLESFGSTRRRLQATQITVEGIMDWVKAAGMKILEMVARLVNFVKNLYQSMFGAAARNERELRAIAKEAVYQARWSGGNVTVTERVLHTLGVAGKFTKETFLEAINGVKSIFQSIFKYFGGLRDSLKDAYETAQINELYNQDARDKKAMDAAANKPAGEGIIGEMYRKTSDAVKGLFKGKEEAAGEGSTAITVATPTLGGDTVTVNIPNGTAKTEEASAKALTSTAVTMNKPEETKSAAGGQTSIPVEDVAEMANAMVDLNKTVAEAGKDLKEVEKVETGLLATLKRWFKAAKDYTSNKFSQFCTWCANMGTAIMNPFRSMGAWFKSKCDAFIAWWKGAKTEDGKPVAAGNAPLMGKNKPSATAPEYKQTSAPNPLRNRLSGFGR